MSDSAETPSSSETSSAATNSTNTSPPPKDSPPPPPEDSSPPPPDSLSASLVLASPPSNSSPTPTSSPPPPPPASASSPPPSPPSSSSSPPSPPPSNSPPHSQAPPTNSHPPPAASPPPTSSTSPSPNLSPPPSSSTSPPPTPAKNVSPPVSGQSSPPPDNFSPKSPPPSGFVPPPASQGTTESPPPPTEFIAPPPPVSNAPPTSSSSNSTSSTVSPPTQSASTSASRGSSSENSSSTSSSTKSYATSTTISVNNTTKVLIGAVVVGSVLIALLAIIFAVKRKKKRQDPYATHYMPPKNFVVQTDGYYNGQLPHVSGFSGQANYSYGSQISQSPDSYGSQNNNGDTGLISGTKTHFSYEEVMEMTNGFASQNIVGEGGFGCVYKGQVQDGRMVAVKQLKIGSGQGDREFKAEVEIISRVHHRHLVSLVGYCICDRQRMLLYEYVPNKTLEHHLHAKGMPVLDWPKRLKIAMGAAKGLAYLHEDCNPKIIHRDIKSANILLEDNFEAQVADFGLARLNDTSQTHVSTRVMGTFGYLAPEYASSGKLTDRSDVYSFGVVLLELITGRKPVDPTQPLGDESLVEWARPNLIHAIETGDLGELVDPRLEKRYAESEMLRMIETAAACVRHSAPKRPRMVQVVRALDSEDMSDLTNGVKYGQSTAYDSGQYNQDIMRFRKMAFASDDSPEFDSVSGEYSSQGPSISNFASAELETQAMRDGVDKRYGGTQDNLGSRRNM